VLDNNAPRNKVVIERCIARYREAGGAVRCARDGHVRTDQHPEDWEKTVRCSLEYRTMGADNRSRGKFA
jgi:hypothetical protein